MKNLGPLVNFINLQRLPVLPPAKTSSEPARLFLPQYHINKLGIMSSDNHMNNSEKEVDEVDAALSDLEITLEGGKTSNTLVRPTVATGSVLQLHSVCFFFFFFSPSLFQGVLCSQLLQPGSEFGSLSLCCTTTSPVICDN